MTIFGISVQSSIISQGSLAAHVVARTISCKNVVFQGYGQLQGLVNLFVLKSDQFTSAPTAPKL